MSHATQSIYIFVKYEKLKTPMTCITPLQVPPGFVCLCGRGACCYLGLGKWRLGRVSFSIEGDGLRGCITRIVERLSGSGFKKTWATWSALKYGLSLILIYWHCMNLFQGYGGFIALHALGDGQSDVFQCGVAVSPVTDWRYYDTAYAERYLGLLRTNYKGYDVSQQQSPRPW